MSLRIQLLLACWISFSMGLCTSCGGGKSTTPATASAIVITPNTLSLNEGQVVSISVQAVDAQGTALTTQPTISFSSSDPSAVTVSNAGAVCAGVWDASFVVCRPGTIPSGTVKVIASTISNGNTVTGSIPVSVHQQIDKIILSAPASPACISQNQSLQFTATAYSNGVDITNTVAAFNWVISDPRVGQVDPNSGLAVGRTPGIANITAAVAGTTSSPLALVVCAPQSIQISPGTALSINKGDTKTLNVSVVDTQNNSVNGATLTFSSSQPAVARTTNHIVTVDVSAVAPGSFTLVASCTPPTCNNAPMGNITTPAGQTTARALGFGFPIYSNVVTGTVAGTTTTSVFVTGPTTLSGAANTSLQAFSSGTLASPTTVTLPNAPNSIMFDPQGQKGYIGSDSGLMILNPTVSPPTVAAFSGTITGDASITTVTGKVLAVSPDGTTVITSDATRGLVFVVTSNSAAVFHAATVRSAAFSPDGFKAFLAGESGVFDYTVSVHSVGLGTATAASSVAYLPGGLAAYVSGSSVAAYATCSSQQIGTASVAAGPLVALQSASPRVIGANTTQWVDLTPSLSGLCPATASTVVSSVNLSPACTPTQITALFDGSQVFGSGLDPSCGSPGKLPEYNVANLTAGSIGLASASGIPLAGVATFDSRQLYIGVLSGTTATVDLIDPVAGKDTLQVSVPFTPSVIAVVPK